MPTRPAEHPTQTRLIARKIAQAGLALGFERLWAALHWPIVILLLSAALVIGGVLPQLPPWPRIAVLLGTGFALLWSLRPLLGVRWPTRHEAMRRVEEKSGLPHRPVSARQDRLAPGADPLQEAIWEEHRLRQLRDLSDLKAGLPQSRWRDIDPCALRLPAALALFAAIVLGPGDTRGNLADSLAFSTPAPATALSVDAWLKPPAYTARPPVLLTSPAMAEKLKAGAEIQVPEKSTLALRISGAKAPTLSFHALTDGNETSAAVSGFSPRIKTTDGSFEAEVMMSRPATVIVKDGETQLGSWRIALIPDAPPSVEITAEPAGDSSGMLTAKWKAADDYGVTGITADIYLADEQDGDIGFADPGIFEFDPPELKISLRKAAPREEAGESRADVAEHPWAGFMVEMTLTARDAAGNQAQSQARVFRLPERQFINPLARALIEQRRNLILNADDAPAVAAMLDALLTYPRGLIEGSGTHIAIAAALSRLRNARDGSSVDSVINMLWKIAVNVEDGRMADAKAEVEALRKELQRALRDGASPERIAELTERLRKALDRYMQEMMAEAQKRMQNGQPQQMPPQGRMISPQDLQKMLDMIQKLAESGANEAAEQMLSELENILRNLQPGMPQQGQMQQGPMNDMLDKLSDLMRQQQKLMDDTQRSQQDGMSEDQGQEGPSGESQQGMGGMGGLGDRQQDLGKMLQELMEQMGRNGLNAPRAFGEAGKNMQGAEGSLRGGDREQALGEQGEAMTKLREGAKGLARQMLQQGQGQQGSEGQTGEARGDDRDPLGRPMPNRGGDTGPDRDMLPSELAIQRAREILEMLRSRAGDTGLPKIERDYIDRLLRGLY